MTEGLPSHHKAPWDASVTFPFYGTSNQIGGRKRTLLISITTDPLSGAWRDGTNQESGVPSSINSWRHPERDPPWCAEVRQSHCVSEAGAVEGGHLCKAFNGGVAASPTSPLLIQEGRSITENNGDGCNYGEPFIGKLLGDTSKT